MRSKLAVAAGALVALAVSAWYASGSGIGADYPVQAGIVIDALLRGDLEAALAASPLQGSLSLLVRTPFAAMAGGDPLLAYRLGTVPCLVAAGVLAIAVERLMARRGQPLVARLVAVGVFAVNPVTADALTWGHPEELLAGALAIGAVVAAVDRRSLLAAVLLGLALATKQWTVLAILPVLIATDQRRVRTLAVAVAIAAVFTLPQLAADASGLAGTARNVAGLASESGARINALNVWWPFAESHHREVSDGVTRVLVEHRSLPDEFVGFTHFLIVALAVPLAALFHRRRPALQREDVLALLALLFLLRCALDPWSNQYYHVPFLLSLATWEGLRRRGLPVVTMLTATAMWLSFDQLAPAGGGGATTAMYLAWALPVAAFLAAWIYAPATVSALGRRLRISQPVPVTATRSSIRTPNAPLT